MLTVRITVLRPLTVLEDYIAFGIAVLYSKPMVDMATGWPGPAIAWEAEGLGTSHGVEGLVGGVSGHVDRFLTEYLRVNESACRGPG